MQFPASSAEVATLANGLRLILDPDPSFPVVSVQAWIANGSIHEDQHLGAGVSHLLEHMVFKGTRSHPGDELARIVQHGGGQWNAYTSFDHTVYYIDGPSDSLDDFLRIVTELTFFPTLPADEFDNECDVIRREIDMGLDDPHTVAAHLLFETAWLRDPRRHPVIGHRNRFDALSHDDMRSFHARRYVPGMVHFVISGNFDPVKTKARLESLTAEAADTASPEPNVPVDPPQCAPRFSRATFRVPTSRIFLAWQTPALDDPDTPAFDLIAGILGQGHSSRLYRRLREERGLALEIGSWCWSQPDRTGLFAVQAECDPSHRDELIDAIRAEVAALADDPDPAELDKIRNQALASRLRVLATASGRASELGANWLAVRDTDFTRRRLEALARVDVDALRQAAGRLSPSRLSTAILDPDDAPAPKQLRSSRKVSHEPEITELDNGLTLVRIHDDRLPLAAVQLAARGGLLAESPQNSGISQLLAAMLPHGSSSRSGPEIAAALEARGARFGARAGNNFILASCGGLAADLPLMLDTLCELANDPAFPADNLQRELASQEAALQEALDDPLPTALRLARASLFTNTGYGLEPLGTPESLASLDRDQLLAHHASHFRAGNLIAAVVGDLRGHDIDSLVARSLASLPAGPQWQPPGSQITAGTHTNHQLPKRQAAIAFAFAIGPAAADDHPALELIHHHCADMAGPLFTRIREELGLAYHVSAMRLPGIDTGAFIFHLATAPEQAETAETAMLEEIQRLADNGLTDAELERARNSTLGALALAAQHPGTLARLAAIDTILGLGPRHPRDLPAMIRDTDTSTVRATAAKYFSTAPVIARINCSGGL